MKRFLPKFIFIILISFNAYAGGFDDLGNSARAASMGGAFLAVSNAPYSLFFNPAGIYNIDRINIATTYSNLFPGIQDDNLNYFSLSGVLPLDVYGKIGVGGTFLNTSHWKESTVSAVYSREIYGNFAIGGAAKLLQWSASAAPGEDALSYLGFTFDIGALYTFKNILSNSNLSLGFAAQNITQPSIASGGSSEGELPMRLGLGASFYSELYRYMINVDAVKENDIIHLKSGVEFSAFKTGFWELETEFLVRAGYNRIVKSDYAEQSGLSGGFGLIVNNVVLDYAYLFPFELSNVGGTHKVSIMYKFN